MSRWLRGLIDIREGERSLTAAMFAYIFTVIAVLIIVKSVRQSLFLQKFGAASLPYVYLLIAAVSGGIAALYQRLSRNLPIHRLVAWTMFVIIGNLAAIYALTFVELPLLPYIFYVWVAVYGILTTAQFWMLANYVYDPRQAKRIFPILGTGATLGGIGGGYITQFTTPVFGTEGLLFIGSALLGACAVLSLYLGRTQARTIHEAARVRRFKDTRSEESLSGFRLIWESKYLKLVMGIIALSIVISTVVDNQFSFVVEEHIPGKDEKTAFFGQFFTWLGWAAFITQFLLTGRLLRRFGVGITMAVLPVAFFLGSGVFVLLPMLATGVLVKIADGAFRYTTHKGSLELLYLPVPIGVKNKTKAFIDMFTDRFSKGIAALLVLLMTTVLGFHYTALSWVLMGLSVIWIGITILTRREYVAAFRDSLLRRRLDDDQLIISRTDAATVGSLAEALTSARTPASARRVLDLVTGITATPLVEPLVKLAHSPDSGTAMTALDRLADFDGLDLGDQLDDLLDSPDVEIVARVLRLSCRDGARLSPLRIGPYLADERAPVRLGAIMCSLSWGEGEGGTAIDAATLEQFLSDSGAGADKTELERMMAKMLRALPAPSEIARTYIMRFLTSNDPCVREEAVAAAGRLKPRELVEPLIRLLSDRRLRYRVRDALAAYGETALGTLEDYFRDERTERALRQQIPRVLEHIPSQWSVAILTTGLMDRDERVRFDALRSLGRLRSRHPDLAFRDERIVDRLDLEIRKAYQYQSWMLGLGTGDEAALLRKTLSEKVRKTVDRVFRLLALTYPPEEVYAASQAIYSPNARIRANAIEYLDNVLDGDRKRTVLGLVEEQPSRERLKRLLRDIGTDEGDGPAALEAVSCWDDDWLSACGLYTVWTMKQEPLYRLFMQESPARQPDRYPIAAETAAVLRQRISNREAG